jgi:oligopeptide/dipeptide ABC transporter ATP-binding protein
VLGGMTALGAPVMELAGVRKEFTLRRAWLSSLTGRPRTVIALDGVDLTVGDGEVVGLVGESGSGKSTLAYAVVRLVPVTAGTIRYRGTDVTQQARRQLRAFWRRVQIIFQDAHSSLNPRKTVGQVLQDPLRVRGISRADCPAEAGHLLSQVGLGPQFLRRYPHELSGGQRQRVVIARALAMSPEFLIADEPVSSLDVSLQAQIVNLLIQLRARLNLSMLFVSHDLALVNHVSHRVAVMYAGRIVEVGTTEEVLRAPAHPYTQALVAATPKGLAGRGRVHEPLAGDPPDPSSALPGCRFAPRCPQVMPVCGAAAPVRVRVSATRAVECHLFGGEPRPAAARPRSATDVALTEVRDEV